MSVDSRSGAKIGVLVPYTNVNLEPDLALMRPEGCTLHSERLGYYDIDEIPGSGQMARLGASDLSESLRLISGIRPAAVLYGCTSATLTHGPDFDRNLAAQIAKTCSARSITAAGALVRAIQTLGATRIGFSSPYLGEINDQAVQFLAQNGIETVARADIGRALGNYGQGELVPDEVYDLALKAVTPEVQAIVLSCTDMRAVEAVARIETETGLPVVTSNQAMVFVLCQELGLPRPKIAPGRLFDRI
ncbi:MAG: Asp/Glu racemase [Pseudomonadota bacterium]